MKSQSASRLRTQAKAPVRETVQKTKAEKKTTQPPTAQEERKALETTGAADKTGITSRSWTQNVVSFFKRPDVDEAKLKAQGPPAQAKPKPKQVREPPVDGWRIMPRLGERGNARFKGSKSDWGRLSDEEAFTYAEPFLRARTRLGPEGRTPDDTEVVDLSAVSDPVHLRRLLSVATRDIERAKLDKDHKAKYKVGDLDRVLSRLNPRSEQAKQEAINLARVLGRDLKQHKLGEKNLTQLKSKTERAFFKGHEYRYPVYPDDPAPLGNSRLADNLSMLFMTVDNIQDLSDGWSSPARPLIDNLLDRTSVTPSEERHLPVEEITKKMEHLASQARITPAEHQRFQGMMANMEELVALALAQEPTFLARYGLCDEDTLKVGRYMDPTSFERAIRALPGARDPMQTLESMRSRGLLPQGERPDIANPLESIRALSRVLELMPKDEPAWWSNLPNLDGVTDHFKERDVQAAGATLRLLVAWSARQPPGSDKIVGPGSISWNAGQMSLEDVSAAAPPKANFRYAKDPERAQKFDQKLANTAVHPGIYDQLDRIKKQAQADYQAVNDGTTPTQRKNGLILDGPAGVGKTRATKFYIEALQAFRGFGDAVQIRPEGRSGSAPTVLNYMDSLQVDDAGNIIIPKNLIFEVDEAHRLSYREVSALMSLAGDDGRDNALILAGYTKEMNELFDGSSDPSNPKRGDKGLLRRVSNRATLGAMDNGTFLKVMRNTLSQYPELSFSDEDLMIRIRTDPEIQSRMKEENADLAVETAYSIVDDVNAAKFSNQYGYSGGKFSVPAELVRGPRREMTPNLRRSMSKLRQLDGMEDAGNAASGHLHRLLNNDRERRGYAPLDALGKTQDWRPPANLSSIEADKPHGMLTLPSGFTGRELLDDMARGYFEIGRTTNPEPVYLKRSDLVDGMVEGTPTKVMETLRQLSGRFVVVDVQDIIKGGTQGKDSTNFGPEVFPAIANALEQGGRGLPSAIYFKGDEKLLKEHVAGQGLNRNIGFKTEVAPYDRARLKTALQRRLHHAKKRVVSKDINKVVDVFMAAQSVGGFAGNQSLDDFMKALRDTSMTPAGPLEGAMHSIRGAITRSETSHPGHIPQEAIERVVGKIEQHSFSVKLFDWASSALDNKVIDRAVHYVGDEYRRTSTINRLNDWDRDLKTAQNILSKLEPEAFENATLATFKDSELRERLKALLGMDPAIQYDPHRRPSKLKGGILWQAITGSMGSVEEARRRHDAATLEESLQPGATRDERRETKKQKKLDKKAKDAEISARNAEAYHYRQLAKAARKT